MQKILAVATLLVLAAPAVAEVKSADAGGFVVASSVTVAASPDAVYAALIRPGRWWNMEHSYSHDGANLTLDPVAGGCFCETVPAAKGSVEHMRVVQAMPGRLLRLVGGMGPLQGMALSGVLSWELKPAGSGTEIRQTYAIGGYVPGGAQPLAPVVDGVLSDQLAHLKAFLDKGRS